MLNYDLCTGCMACLNVCPKNAISCVENDLGFIIPSIDNSICVNCGLCEKTCILNNDFVDSSPIQNTIALVHKNKDVLKKSTSGGAFTAISDIVLKQNGVIVGAFMDDEFSVYHVVTKDPLVRDKMRGSKYVQSNVNECYREIRKQLELGVSVLFVGTPCQVHGLRQFLKKDYDLLYVVDILCHGVPNNRMLKDHISYISRLEKSEIVDYHFRTKRFGRRNSIQEYKLFDSNKFTTTIDAQEYASFFRQSLSLRPSCRVCRYRSSYRFGDLSIGDYWGTTGVLNNGKTGMSLICINTQKGKRLVDSIENVDYLELDKEAITSRPEFNAPSSSNQDKYKLFWDNYRKFGYQRLVTQYFHVSIIGKLRFHVKSLLSKLSII